MILAEPSSLPPIRFRTKVLIADEEIIVRQAIARVLKNTGGFEITVCDDMEETEQLIHNLHPDVLILNLVQSQREGLKFFQSLREKFPKLPIVVLSPRNLEGATIAIEALRYGAIDFVTKPDKNNMLLFADRHLSKRLIPAVQTASQQSKRERIERLIHQSVSASQGSLQGLPGESDEKTSIEPASIVVIGACSGGPKALFELLPNLPKNLAVPIVIVQHLPKYYTKVFADQLNKITTLKVEEAYDDVELKSGSVWIIPGGRHAEVQLNGNKKTLKLHRGPREKGFRPSIDLLFRSASRIYRSGTLGIVLSGCGEDGLVGAESVRNHGGQILVQDPCNAISFSLPLSLIKEGHFDNIYTLQQLSDQIIHRTRPRRDLFRRKISKNMFTS